jgi:hypothetical protein
MARWSLAALVVLSGAGAFTEAASALTRAQADRIAIRALKPQREAGMVRVFGLRRPLGPRRRVDILRRTTTRLTRRPLGRRTWLYWEDLVFRARFEHPSVMLLIDDRTGRVRSRRRLDWYPLVDGRAPGFVRDYGHDRYLVWGPRSGTSLRGATTSQGPPPYVITPQDLAQDCLVTIGDRGHPRQPGDTTGLTAEPGSSRDLNAMEDFADRVRLRRRSAPSSAKGLRDTVADVVNNDGCRDVFIFLTGHGVAPRGVVNHLGQQKFHPGGPAGVIVQRSVTTDSRGEPIRVRSRTITPNNLEKIVDEHRTKATFKIKVEACYSGRFFFALSDKPNVKVLELSSAANEASYMRLPDPIHVYDDQQRQTRIPNPTNPINPGLSEFVHRNIRGLERWARNPFEVAASNRQLARGIARSFTLGAIFDAAARNGLTHPILHDRSK